MVVGVGGSFLLHLLHFLPHCIELRFELRHDLFVLFIVTEIFEPRVSLSEVIVTH